MGIISEVVNVLYICNGIGMAVAFAIKSLLLDPGLLSMFELTLANWPPVTRLLTEETRTPPGNRHHPTTLLPAST